MTLPSMIRYAKIGTLKRRALNKQDQRRIPGLVAKGADHYDIATRFKLTDEMGLIYTKLHVPDYEDPTPEDEKPPEPKAVDEKTTEQEPAATPTPKKRKPRPSRAKKR